MSNSNTLGYDATSSPIRFGSSLANFMSTTAADVEINQSFAVNTTIDDVSENVASERYSTVEVG